MTKKKSIKDQSDSTPNLSEVILHLDEKVKSKLLSQEIIGEIGKEINFTCYIENKNTIRIVGDNIFQLRGVAYILESLSGAIKKLSNEDNFDLILDYMDDLLDEVINTTGNHNYTWSGDVIIKAKSGKFIAPKTKNQDKLVESIKDNVITVVKGCAGTGKSTISVAMAISYLYDNRFDKILIVRPLTSVGGKEMGFLPGNADEKYGPYTSALVESIIEIIGETKYNELIRNKKIILTPATFTRGANFKNSIVIVDEAQNLSEVEILTLLTRLCDNGKIIITGDESQDDRRDKRFNESALTLISEKLSEIDNVGIVTMTVDDVQRHGIVKDIINAFE